MYCGSCLRDNALAAELIARGHDVTLLPVYTPTLTDEPNVSGRRVFFGGISVYLQQMIFPEYVRKIVELGADIVINSTDWINDPYQRDVWGWNAERIQSLASTRALENVVPLAMACRTGREVAAPDVAFDSTGPSCVVSPSGKFLARIDAGEGIVVGHIDISAAEMDRWTSIATYRNDRRPDLYR